MLTCATNFCGLSGALIVADRVRGGPGKLGAQ
jgi:hypothetical protein